MALRRAVCACRGGFAGTSVAAPTAVPMGGRSITVDVIGDDADGVRRASTHASRLAAPPSRRRRLLTHSAPLPPPPWLPTTLLRLCRP